ncbi:elongation factor P hydroxylase [Cobetia sp. 5-11-6-3]|uniref:elongation factor P hydroxylase n=1 Tax=Cobetia sp. 5-11-6-3 TaxID=2737458 RepID=UPI0035A73096
MPDHALAGGQALTDQESMDPELTALTSLFDRLFATSYNTLLRRAPHEPLYLPAGMTTDEVQDGVASGDSPGDELGFHRLYLARGFFSSALHEVSHWCIAGPERRLKEDYGYWYAPDGRDAHQQKAFESVEVAPQALEQLFHRAVAKPFHVSVDNLELEVDRDAFAQRVDERAAEYERCGLPARANAFRHALHAVWQRKLSHTQAIQEAMMLLPAVGEDGRVA